jgi:hypothetical protein
MFICLKGLYLIVFDNLYCYRRFKLHGLYYIMILVEIDLLFTVFGLKDELNGKLGRIYDMKEQLFFNTNNK